MFKMRLFAKLSLRFRSLFRRNAADAELDSELRLHIDKQIAANLAAGMSRDEARRHAMLEFGGVEELKEECREMRKINWLQDLMQDVRYGLRMLRKSPGFTAVAVVTLALGIGANTAIFSIIDSLLLRPLNVENPSQLAVLAFRQGSGPLLPQFSIADYRDIRSQSTAAFSDILGFQLGFDGLSLQGKADRVLTNYVTGNYFSLLGLKPYLGRLILPSEGQTRGADPVVVLSYSFWQTRFGADPSIIGKKVLINGKPGAVVGVAPPRFYGLYPAPGVQAYIPLAMVDYYELGWPSDFLVNRILQNLYVLGRLRQGVSVSNAAASLSVIAQRLSAQYPDTDKGMTLSVYSERFARPDPGNAPVLITSAALFLALVALVLLLACANIANLLLVRATIREREMAVRAALGAARNRLIRQLLTESIVLALIGGAAGLLLGLWGSRAIASIDLHTPVPVNIYFGFDWRVFSYAFAAALLMGILFGLVPALRVSRTQINAALHESSRSVAAGKNRFRTTLVVLQVAGSLMLLVIAGLFTRSLAAVQHANLGFDPRNVVNMTMDPTEVGYNEALGIAFYNDLLDRIRALPGVEAAALGGSTPLGDVGSNDYLKISDYQVPPGQGLPLVWYSVVSRGYFEMMRIPIERGRSFTGADAKNAPYVAIVNEAFAKRFWPNQDPIGKHFAKVSGVTNPLYEVVGVARNSRTTGLAGPIDAYFYLPLAQDYLLATLQYLQVRSAAPPDTIIREAEGVVHSLAPDLPVFTAQTMTQSLNTLSGFLLFRLAAGLAAALGLLGLALAVVGIYGVISCSVSQRTHEIGIRIALGAQRGQILKLILGQGLLIISFGVLAGCVAAFAAARLVANLLVGVSPSDPLTYFGVSFILAVVALLACYIPARRAMKVDPMVALRYE
ncbi:MAG TPA: ABC transporter permease [Candidatus Acidoferrales bacterium]|nr:ABC transporter permease [Candidatus Acidoferrales bacterium]